MSPPDTPAGAPTPLEPSAPEAALRRRCDRFAKILVGLLLALLLHSAWRVGPTYDEHVYVSSGYAYLQDWEFSINREHPPLVKLLVGLPLLLAPDVEWPEKWRQLNNYPVSFFYQRNAEHLDRNLFLVRVPIALLTVLLAWILYRTGRRLWGPRAGLVALLLFGFNPNVLAHGHLAVLDSGLTVFLFLSVLSYVELLEKPGPRRALGAGVLFGLANLAKFTSLVLGPFFALLAAVACLRRRSLAPAGWTLLVWFSGLGVFAAGYGFEARSVNEAWSIPSYVIDVRNPEVLDVKPGHLAEAAREAGLSAQHVQRIQSAPNLSAAIDVAGYGSRNGPAEAQAALQALAQVELAGADYRKRAFPYVLEAPAGVDPELQLEVLARLARIELPDLGAWRDWYARNRFESWNRVIFSQGWIDTLTRGLLGDARPIPLFTAFKGIDYQLYHAVFGHGSYYRGETLWAPGSFAEGNPYPEYYANVLAVKNPLPWLLLCGLGLLLACVPGRALGRLRPAGAVDGSTLLRSAAFAGLPLLLFYVFSTGNALMGVKYLLPIFPFLALLGARLTVYLPRLTLVLAGLSALMGLRYHPHELMYYNELAGGPRGGPEITVVGDDWGQGVRGVGRFYARYRDEIEAAEGLHYSPYTISSPGAFGLENAIPVRGPVRGIVAVNAINYWRDKPSPRDEERSYAWLDEYEPFLVIDQSVYLYDTREGAPGRDPLPAWDP